MKHRNTDAGDLLQTAAHRALEGAVAPALVQAVQIAAERAHVPGDGHLVVVQNHDHPRLALARVVERLVAHAAGQRTVADEGDHAVVRMHHVPRARHAQRRRDRAGGVSGHEGVVDTLVCVREAAESTLLAQRAELLVPAGEHLVHVTLVPYVKDEPILRAVEHAVHRQRQLHHAQVGRKVAAALRNGVNELRADLGSQRLQLPIGHLFQL